MTDIDEIVRLVRFPGWQSTKAGEREVQRVLLFRNRIITSGAKVSRHSIMNLNFKH